MGSELCVTEALVQPPADFNPTHKPDNPTCTFWIQATPGTTYWRCVIPAKALGGQAIPLLPEDTRGTFPNQYGPAVWQFPGNPGRGRIMKAMREHGIPVFVEVDDNYLVDAMAIPGVKPNWITKVDPDNPDMSSREFHRVIVENACDGVIVSTNHLKKYYDKRHENVHVCLNSVDPDDWPEPEKPDDGVLRIGYAFSTSHYWDWKYIIPALEYAASQKDVEVVLIGMPPPFAALNRFKYVNLKWSDNLEEYRKNLGILDVGFAPIRPGHWADSRSDIKAMEYAMAGAMTVASPTESYTAWGDEEGLPRVCLMPLENTPKAWLKIITWLLKNRDVVPEIAQEAKDYVIDQRTIATGVESWREAFASVGCLV